MIIVLGFYRVNYDDDSWRLITLALRGDDRTVIHEINRGQVCISTSTIKELVLISISACYYNIA